MSVKKTGDKAEPHFPELPPEDTSQVGKKIANAAKIIGAGEGKRIEPKKPVSTRAAEPSIPRTVKETALKGVKEKKPTVSTPSRRPLPAPPPTKPQVRKLPDRPPSALPPAKPQVSTPPVIPPPPKPIVGRHVTVASPTGKSTEPKRLNFFQSLWKRIRGGSRSEVPGPTLTKNDSKLLHSIRQYDPLSPPPGWFSPARIAHKFFTGTASPGRMKPLLTNLLTRALQNETSEQMNDLPKLISLVFRGTEYNTLLEDPALLSLLVTYIVKQGGKLSELKDAHTPPSWGTLSKIVKEGTEQCEQKYRMGCCTRIAEKWLQGQLSARLESSAPFQKGLTQLQDCISKLQNAKSINEFGRLHKQYQLLLSTVTKDCSLSLPGVKVQEELQDRVGDQYREATGRFWGLSDVQERIRSGQAKIATILQAGGPAVDQLSTSTLRSQLPQITEDGVPETLRTQFYGKLFEMEAGYSALKKGASPEEIITYSRKLLLFLSGPNFVKYESAVDPFTLAKSIKDATPRFQEAMQALRNSYDALSLRPKQDVRLEDKAQALLIEHKREVVKQLNKLETLSSTCEKLPNKKLLTYHVDRAKKALERYRAALDKPALDNDAFVKTLCDQSFTEYIRAIADLEKTLSTMPVTPDTKAGRELLGHALMGFGVSLKEVIQSCSQPSLRAPLLQQYSAIQQLARNFTALD